MRVIYGLKKRDLNCQETVTIIVRKGDLNAEKGALYAEKG